MVKIKKFSVTLLFFITLYANNETKLAESANFNEETTTAFSILGISPATINNFGSAKEIKADWFYKNGNLVDTIAIEFKPLWYIILKDKNYQEYKEMNYLSKKLSDTSLSIGMDTKNETNRRAALSLNINIFKKADPLLDEKLLHEINSVYLKREKYVLKEILKKEMELQIAGSESEKDSIKKVLEELNKELEVLSENEAARVEKIISTYKKNNWNNSFINIGYGNLQSFVFNNSNNDFRLDLRDLKNVVWLHYGFPIYDTVLVSFLNRGYLNESKLLNGVNARFYIDEKNTFFLEFINTLQFKIIEETEYNFAFGGSFKIKKAIINLGFTLYLDNKFSYVNLNPKYDISFRR